MVRIYKVTYAREMARGMINKKIKIKDIEMSERELKSILLDDSEFKYHVLSAEYIGEMTLRDTYQHMDRI